MIVKSHSLFENSMVRSLLQAFENSIFSFVITETAEASIRHEFLYVNKRFKDQTGYDEADLKNHTPKILQGEKTDARTLSDMRQHLEKAEPFIGQTFNYRKDGSEYIVRWSINPIFDDNKKVIAFISCQQEITEMVHKEEEAFFLAEALNQSADAALIADLQGTIVYANSAFKELTGYDISEIRGKNTRIFKSGKIDKSFYRNMWQTLNNNEPFKGLFLNRHKNGQEFFEQKTITPILDAYNHPQYFLAISKDSSEVIEKTHHLEYKAYHDSLTGLFNRSKFDEVVTAKLRQRKLNNEPVGLIVCDVDDFKKLNDTYGHDTGDEVLKTLSKLIQSSVRKDDLVFRWGGEEFCILIDSDLSSTQIVAEQLKDRVSQLIIKSMPNRKLTMSFGATEALPSDDAETFFKRADKALYQAKSSGKNQVQILHPNL